MNNLIKQISLYLILLFYSVVSAHNDSLPSGISIIHSVNPINNWHILKEIDSESLIFVNLDDVLLTPKSSILGKSSPHRSFVDNMIAFSKKDNSLNQPLKTLFENRLVELSELYWIDLIDKATSTGATVIGISKTDCKIIQLVSHFEERRHKEISALSIRFTDKINKQSRIQLSNSAGVNSSFYKGILFTGPFSESEAIIDLIKSTHIFPNKIFVFDVDVKNLLQLESNLARFDIKYYGIYYLNTMEQIHRTDSQIVEFQQNQLLQNNKWFEDEQAAKLLKLNDNSQAGE